MKTFTFYFVFFFVALATQVQAQATLSFQGVIKNSDGTAVENGTYSIEFKLYESQSGGTPIWTETHANVQVTGGIYSVILGEITPLGVAFDKTYHLSMAVDGGAEIVPRVQLTSSPYSLAVTGNSNVVPSDGNVGVGTLSPSEKIHVIGNAKIDGDLEVTGGIIGNMSADTIAVTGDVTVNNKSAAVGEEGYRIIMGKINSDGSVAYGAGFTSSKISSGLYKITFNTPFPSNEYAISYTVFTDPDQIGSISDSSKVTANDIEIGFRDADQGGYTDNDFMFTIIGPR